MWGSTALDGANEVAHELADKPAIVPIGLVKDTLEIATEAAKSSASETLRQKWMKLQSNGQQAEADAAWKAYRNAQAKEAGSPLPFPEVEAAAQNIIGIQSEEEEEFWEDSANEPW